MSDKGFRSAVRLWITGIPTAGKSYLAKKLAAACGGIAVCLDDLRDSASKKPQYKQWTDFYLNQDEKIYLTQTDPQTQWQNLVAQSEGLWSLFEREIAKYEHESRPVIFECVNLLPHIAHTHLKFPGVVLVGKSFEETLERNKKDPRWGDTEELQKLEAETFFFVERPKYISEAKKYGYPVFETAEEAEKFVVDQIFS